MIGAGGAIGFDAAGLVNGADGGTVEGVVTAGLVTGTVGEEKVEGVGSGYMTGIGVVEEGGLVEVAVMGVGRGFREGMVIVGFVEGMVDNGWCWVCRGDCGHLDRVQVIMVLHFVDLHNDCISVQFL